MHELGITRNMVAIVDEHAQGARVARVRLAVGRLTAVEPEALRFCFDVCSSGTLVEGAALEIVDCPGRWRCRDCGTEFQSDAFAQPCVCGSTGLDCVGGEELKIMEMETV